MDPELVKKILAVLESQDEKAALALLPELIASMAGVPPEAAPEAEALAEGAEPKPPAPGVEPSALAKSLGCKTDAEAAAVVTALLARVTKIDAENATVELSARQGLVTDLVKLGVEFPAHCWEGKPEDRKPVKRLLDEPIASLRARVELHKAQGGKPGITPPPSGETKPVTLSKAEQKYCTEHGLTKEQFEAKKANAVRTVK